MLLKKKSCLNLKRVKNVPALVMIIWWWQWHSRTLSLYPSQILIILCFKNLKQKQIKSKPIQQENSNKSNHWYQEILLKFHSIHWRRGDLYIEGQEGFWVLIIIEGWTWKYAGVIIVEEQNVLFSQKKKKKEHSVFLNESERNYN